MSDDLDDETRAIINSRRRKRRASPVLVAALSLGGLVAILLLLATVLILAAKRGAATGGGLVPSNPLPASPNDIASAYIKNPIDGEAKYHGRWVVLPPCGVARIDHAGFGGAVVQLNHHPTLPTPARMVNAAFATSDAVRGLKPGDQLVVAGRLAAFERGPESREGGILYPTWTIVLESCEVMARK